MCRAPGEIQTGDVVSLDAPLDFQSNTTTAEIFAQHNELWMAADPAGKNASGQAMRRINLVNVQRSAIVQSQVVAETRLHVSPQMLWQRARARKVKA
jgi:hypothetical protein